MKKFNLSKGTIYFPLADGQVIENNTVYEIVNGKAQKITGTPTGNLLGVCVGGDKLRSGYVMLDIDSTSVFEENYEGEVPTVGNYVAGCKLVISVNAENKTFEYILKKEATV